MARTKKTIKPELKIIKALIRNSELEQYKMPIETDLSYRTILRMLKPMENEGLIKQVRTEPSKKGGKEKKIFAQTFKGTLTYLNSIKPQLSNYLIDGKICYSLEKTNEIIVKNLQPFTLDTIVIFLENLGKQDDLPIFKQINWLKEHYGLAVFRAIVSAASTATDKGKLPNLNKIQKRMFANGEKSENVKSTIKDFQLIESNLLRDAFTEAFAYQLSFLEGTGDLHNDTLKRLFANLFSEIEKRDQSTLVIIKQLVQIFR